MFIGMEMMMCFNFVVLVEVMQYIVQVEFGVNFFVIGVVGGQLVWQFVLLDEVLVIVQMFDVKGYDYLFGVVQVNCSNFGCYGFDIYVKVFDVCVNVIVGVQIFVECYGCFGQDWGKVFSCYYLGNFVIGYCDGYVQKVYVLMWVDVLSQVLMVLFIFLRFLGVF